IPAAQMTSSDFFDAGEGAKVPGYLYRYGSGKMPTSILAAIGHGQRLAPDPAAAYTTMVKAAQAAGFQPWVTDSFRSSQAQETELLNSYRHDPNRNTAFSSAQ